jgi:hypothetical protein
MSNAKPGNQERLSLTENHEKRKNQDFKLKKEKKAKKRERERAQHATTVHAKHDTTEQWPESKKVFRTHGAFPATSKWNRRLDKDPKKNLKIEMVGELTVSNVIQKSKWKQTTPRELDSHLLLSPCRQARGCDD